MDTPKKKPIHIKPNRYQPRKSEIEEEFRVEVPGKTVEEKMERIAKAIFRQTDVREDL